ncbi:MAG: hypothetical protein ABIN94_01605 [Ferruginibacter sp.]
METLPNAYNLTYTPQANIPLVIRGNLVSVSAGGTLSNNTFRLYKDGVMTTTQTGDSSFQVNTPGVYNITVTNSIATQLTLSTNPPNVSVQYNSIADGNWNDPSIWLGGVVPGATAQVTINNHVTVTTNTTCYSLSFLPPGGSITVNTGINLTVSH